MQIHYGMIMRSLLGWRRKMDRLSKWFYKYAVETPEWYPEDFREILGDVEKVEKHPLLKDFRDKLDASEETKILGGVEEKPYESIFLDAIINVFSHIWDNHLKLNNILKAKYGVIETFLKMQRNDQIGCIRLGKIDIGKVSLKLVKLYNMVLNEYNKNAANKIDIPAMDENFPGKKDWDNRATASKLSIVFSSQYKDIVEMSVRSEWGSCQDFTERGLYPQESRSAIGSCLSKYIGIVYITNEKDYQGRGERMIYRSVVYLLTTQNMDEYVAVISTVYPAGNPNTDLLKKIFEKYVGKHFGIPTRACETTLELNEFVGKNFGRIYEELPKEPYIDIQLPRVYSKEFIQKKVDLGEYSYLQFANKDWEEFRGWITKAIYDGDSNAIKYADKNWDDYKDLVKRSIQRWGFNIEFADKSWDNYYELCELAAKRNPGALLDMFDNGEIFEIPNWEKLLDMITDKKPNFILDISPERFVKIPNIMKYVMKLLEKEPAMYEFLIKKFEPDSEEYKQIILYTAENTNIVHALNLAKQFPEFKNILMRKIATNPQHIGMADPSWEEYVDLAIIAGLKDPYVIQQHKIYKHPEYKKIALGIFEKDPHIGIGLIDSSWDEYKQCAIKAAMNNPHDLRFVRPDWAEYVDVAKNAIRRDPKIIAKIDPTRLYKGQYNELANFAVEIYPKAIDWIEAFYVDDIVELKEKAGQKMASMINPIKKHGSIRKALLFGALIQKLAASRIEWAKKRFPEFEEQINFLSQNDPSGSNKYVEWGIKQYKNGHDLQEVAGIINAFHKNIQRLQNKNLQSYSFDDLKKTLEDISKKKTRTDISKEVEKLPLDNDDYELLYIGSWDAAKKYGAGTKWCVTDKGSDDNFNKYGQGFGRFLYFLINKNTDEKFAFVQNENSLDAIYNAEDKQIYSKEASNATGLNIQQILNLISIDTKNRFEKAELEAKSGNFDAAKYLSLKNPEHLELIIESVNNGNDGLIDRIISYLYDSCSGNIEVFCKIFDGLNDDSLVKVISRIKSNYLISSYLDSASPPKSKVVETIIEHHPKMISYCFYTQCDRNVENFNEIIARNIKNHPENIKYVPETWDGYGDLKSSLEKSASYYYIWDCYGKLGKYITKSSHNSAKYGEYNSEIIKLAASRLEIVKKKYPDLEKQIDFLSRNDPSGQNKYLMWGIEQYKNGHIMSEIYDVIRSFHKNLQRIKKKDLNKYSFDDAKKIVDELDEKKTRGQKNIQISKNVEKLPIGNDDFDLLWIGEHDAAQKYGTGTEWCVTEKDPSRFNQYGKNDGKLLYFLINKKADSRTDRFAKIAIVCYKGEVSQVFDANDNLFNILEVKGYYNDNMYNDARYTQEEREALLEGDAGFVDKMAKLKINFEDILRAVMRHSIEKFNEIEDKAKNGDVESIKNLPIYGNMDLIAKLINKNNEAAINKVIAFIELNLQSVMDGDEINILNEISLDAYKTIINKLSEKGILSQLVLYIDERFPRYEELMKIALDNDPSLILEVSDSIYDFDNMLKFSIIALNKNPSLIANFQKDNKLYPKLVEYLIKQNPNNARFIDNGYDKLKKSSFQQSSIIKYSIEDLTSPTTIPDESNIPQWPISSFKSYGEFGAGDKEHQERHKGEKLSHAGIDLGAEKGTPAKAMLPGIVKSISKESSPWQKGNKMTQGNAILIAHDGGLTSLYCHMESINVSVGEKVDKNTIIGTVGNSGNARFTSPHIHFEVSKNGQKVNPRSIIGKADLEITKKKKKSLVA